MSHRRIEATTPKHRMPTLELLIAQILTILAAARLIGWLFRKIHQPRVIGEMIAGILLGPSLFGWLAPGLHETLFPASSLGYLSSLSYVGLLLFMFLVGLELDLTHLRELGRAAVVTSQVSIILPFVFGSLFALYLYPRLSDPNVNVVGFVLFMGAAMSVTAFPVLARILTEHNMLRTRIGAVAITCAAVDDVTAWCILAGIIVIVRSSSSALPLWLMLTGLVGFVLLMLFVVRRVVVNLKSLYQKRGSLTADTIAIVLLLVLTSSLITESLGVHALFGAFLAGVVMPRHPGLSRELSQKFEAVVVVLLLPLYFALTGLRSSFFLIAGGAHVVLRRGDYCSRGCRQVGRLDDLRSNEWDDVARIGGGRCSLEHARARRISDSQHRARSRSPLTRAVLDDGIDGAGHDFDDHAFA